MGWMYRVAGFLLVCSIYWGLVLPTVAIDKGVAADGLSLAWLKEREKFR